MEIIRQGKAVCVLSSLAFNELFSTCIVLSGMYVLVFEQFSRHEVFLIYNELPFMILRPEGWMKLNSECQTEVL